MTNEPALRRALDALIDAVPQTRDDATRALFVDALSFASADREIKIRGADLPASARVVAERAGVQVVTCAPAGVGRAFQDRVHRISRQLRWNLSDPILVVPEAQSSRWHVVHARYVAGLLVARRIVTSTAGSNVAVERLARLRDLNAGRGQVLDRAFGLDELVERFQAAVATCHLRVSAAFADPGASDSASRLLSQLLLIRLLWSKGLLPAGRWATMAASSGSSEFGERVLAPLLRELSVTTLSADAWAPALGPGVLFDGTADESVGLPDEVFASVIRDLGDAFDIGFHDATPWSVPVAIRPIHIAQALTMARTGQLLSGDSAAGTDEVVLAFVAQELVRSHLFATSGRPRNIVQTVIDARNARILSAAALADLGEIVDLPSAEAMRAALRELTVLDIASGGASWLAAIVDEMAEMDAVLERIVAPDRADAPIAARRRREAATLRCWAWDPLPAVARIARFRLNLDLLASEAAPTGGNLLMDLRERVTGRRVFEGENAMRSSLNGQPPVALMLADLPYIRRAYAPDLDERRGGRDIYAAVNEAAERVLSASGRIALVQSLSFDRADYGEALRHVLGRAGSLEKLVEFGTTNMHYVESSGLDAPARGGSRMLRGIMGLLGLWLLERQDAVAGRTQVHVKRRVQHLDQVTILGDNVSASKTAPQED